MKRDWLSPLSTVRKLSRSSVNAGNQLENRSAHHPEISEEIKSCVSVGKSSWKKCADIAQQLRCIVKPRRFDLFKSGLFWSKPNGGTVSPWPNSKTILTLTARIMTKSCTSLHTRTSDVRWLPPRECSHASGLSRPQAKLARLVSIFPGACCGRGCDPQTRQSPKSVGVLRRAAAMPDRIDARPPLRPRA